MHPTPTIVDRMLEAVEPIWQQYYEHPFVRGLGDGTLDQRKFRYYIIQDYLYLVEYAKVFALGVTKSKHIPLMSSFARTILALTDAEMDIHRGYMGRLEITQEEIDTMERHLDNLSYTSYMLRVAYEEGEAEIIAAILSCGYSYECIAKRLLADNPDADKHDFYGEWITGYASDEYAKPNTVMMEHLVALTQHYTEEQLQHLIDIFVACSRYELAFWNFSWNAPLV